MRRREVQNPIRPSEKATSLPRNGADRPAKARSQLMLTALAILSLALMFASRAALASNDLAMLDPLPSPPASLAPSVKDGAAFPVSSSFPEATPEFTEPAAQEPLPSDTRPLVAVPVGGLEALLVLRAAPQAARVADVDATIAAAVAEGSRPDLEKKTAFRKKKIDLFTTERQVEILRNDMLLRLRLRAKSRETMSVELRF